MNTCTVHLMVVFVFLKRLLVPNVAFVATHLFRNLRSVSNLFSFLCTWQTRCVKQSGQKREGLVAKIVCSFPLL